MHTTSKGHIIQLDGIRFIAVALVLIDHLLADINTIPFGPLGVTIFFVLSGFLITRILLKSKEKTASEPGGFKKYLRKFLIRRTIRIFPVYYLCIAVLYILDVPPVREQLAWLALYGTNIYIAVNQHWMGVVDHFWSLAVEEQVYLFFPFLIFFVSRKNLIPWLGFMGVFSVALRFYFYFSGKEWFVSYVTMPACLDSFALGGLMAWLQLYKTDVFVRLFNKSWPVVLGLLSWILLHYISKHLGQKYNIANVVLDRLVSSIFCFFLIGRGVIGYGGLMKFFLENPVSVYLGKISYGIYLYHNFVYNHFHSGPNHPVVRFFNKAYRNFPELENYPAFQVVSVCIFTVMIASVSWHFFEKPINALKDKYAG
ncbi:O-acetyltransferase OatA [Dyadobacter sp. CECT 9275]|uniref:O-acetyltransferase OatA n=1 Tax=Dyadobacter helix TaxID=2822344 RepID=A0A916JCL6_9BACT|nr:acyltransferase [Dyadobacter sp. CECT 9275]CAG5002856.1 O-acetyltransferase OatA [Dyadobacter sp. CECT 9275]